MGDQENPERKRLLPPVKRTGDYGTVVPSRRVRHLFNPSNWPYRYVMLALIGIIKIFNFYFGDVPASLEDYLISLLDIDTAQYSLINAVYQGTNLVGCVIGGLLLDRVVGLRRGVLIFSGVMLIGQTLFAVGAFFDLYWLVLFGQAVLGVSSQVVEIATAALIGVLFVGKELNFAFAILSSLDRLGGIIAFNTDGLLYQDFQVVSSDRIRLASVLFVGGGYALIMVICAVIIVLFDTQARKYMNNDAIQKRFQLGDLKQVFSVPLWLIILTGSLYYTAFFGLSYNGKVYFERKFGLNARKANFANSILYIVPAVLCPLIGLAIDAVGFNLYWSMFGILCSVASSVILIIGSSSFAVYLALIINGLSYAVTDSSIFPMTVLVVRKNMLASAYSIQEGVLNVGFVLTSLIVGLIADSRGYLVLQVCLIVMQFLALGLAILLYLVDSARQRKLTRPGKKLVNLCTTERVSVNN